MCNTNPYNFTTSIKQMVGCVTVDQLIHCVDKITDHDWSTIPHNNQLAFVVVALSKLRDLLCVDPASEDQLTTSIGVIAFMCDLAKNAITQSDSTMNTGVVLQLNFFVMLWWTYALGADLSAIHHRYLRPNLDPNQMSNTSIEGIIRDLERVAETQHCTLDRQATLLNWLHTVTAANGKFKNMVL